MLKKTVLEVLNAEAQSLGSPPVTDRILRDWILEDFFSGPTEKGLGRGLGSEWSYSPAALRAALEIVRLKASGAKRRNTVRRIRVWLLGFHVPTRRIKEDSKSEFDRLADTSFATHSDTMPARAAVCPSARRKESGVGLALSIQRSSRLDLSCRQTIS
jgi:hypothetical protein